MNSVGKTAKYITVELKVAPSENYHGDIEDLMNMILTSKTNIPGEASESGKVACKASLIGESGDGNFVVGRVLSTKATLSG